VFFFCGISSIAEAVVECVAFRKRSCSRVGSSSESEYLTRSWRERDLLLDKCSHLSVARKLGADFPGHILRATPMVTIK
jgi:hypothetical protein